MSPTQRSLELLRKEGWLCEVVERWIPGAQIRRDLWGFIDVLAIRDGQILGVQATSRSNISSRVSKIANHDNIVEVRKTPIALEVWGWAKNSNGRWEVKRVDVS